MKNLSEIVSLLRPLSYFAVAARHGSFSSAAKELSVTPSVVSRTVGSLEQRLGVTLFYRGKTSLSLTAQGREAYEAALAIIESAEESAGSLTQTTQAVRGPVAITAGHDGGSAE